MADFSYPVFDLWICCSQIILNYLIFHFFIMSVPDEDYSSNVSCAHNIYVFIVVLLTLQDKQNIPTFLRRFICTTFDQKSVFSKFRANKCLIFRQYTHIVVYGMT